MNFANVGLSGLLLILVVLIFVFGPSKLPEIGKAFGRSLKEFREATRGISDDIAASARTDAARSPITTESATQTTSAAVPVEPIELQHPSNN